MGLRIYRIIITLWGAATVKQLTETEYFFHTISDAEWELYLDDRGFAEFIGTVPENVAKTMKKYCEERDHFHYTGTEVTSDDRTGKKVR